MLVMWALCPQCQAFWSSDPLVGVCSKIMGQSLHVEMHDSVHAFKTVISETGGLS